MRIAQQSVLRVQSLVRCIRQVQLCAFARRSQSQHQLLNASQAARSSPIRSVEGGQRVPMQVVLRG